MVNSDEECLNGDTAPLVGGIKSSQYSKPPSNQGKCKKLKWICIAISLIVAITIIGVVIFICIDDYDFYDYSDVFPPQQKTKKILIMNTFRDEKFWDSIKYPYNGFLSETHCPFNCIIRTSEYNSENYQDYDAIVINGLKINDISSNQWTDLRWNRTSEQLFVFAASELLNNEGIKRNYIQPDIPFNLTMKYTLDSDVPYLKYAFRPSPIYPNSDTIVSPAIHPRFYLREEFIKEHILSIVAKKGNFAFTYNRTQESISNYQEKFIEEIKKYVNVTDRTQYKCIPRYGYSCPLDDEVRLKDFKFFFDFENARCTDLVTENFFKALSETTIPVVFGGGVQYSRFAPPKSFIDAETFTSIRELADYLRFLDENPEKYAEYFWWKGSYRLTEIESPFCGLCTYLNEDSLYGRRRGYFKQQKMLSELMKDDKCVTGSNLSELRYL